MARVFIDTAKVMAKGQITIPKDVRDAIGIKTGDRVTFVVEGNTVKMVNSAIYAMHVFQSEMEGVAEKAGIYTDTDVMDMVRELRSEDKK